MSDKKNRNQKPGTTADQNETAPSGPSAAMLALFSAPKGLELESKKAKRRTLPQMVLPADVPEGGIVYGEILQVVNSPVSTVKGKLLWMKHPETGTEFLFPVTGVIRSALAPGVKADDDALQGILEKEIGGTLYAKKMPSKMSDKYKKEMFVFDVWTVAK